jgi:hypothetical protein
LELTYNLLKIIKAILGRRQTVTFVPLVEQELSNVPERLSSSLVFSGVRLAQNLKFSVYHL